MAKKNDRNKIMIPHAPKMNQQNRLSVHLYHVAKKREDVTVSMSS